MTQMEAEAMGAGLGMELPAEMAEHVGALRRWAAERGPKAECAVFCAFLPAVAEIDREGHEVPYRGFNPMGVQDGDVARARLTLIQIRDSFLMPSFWEPEKVVLLSHAIAELHDILAHCVLSGAETDGVGRETG